MRTAFALRTLCTGVTLVALRALDPLRTLFAFGSLRTLFARVAFGSCRSGCAARYAEVEHRRVFVAGVLDSCRRSGGKRCHRPDFDCRGFTACACCPGGTCGPLRTLRTFGSLRSCRTGGTRGTLGPRLALGTLERALIHPCRKVFAPHVNRARCYTTDEIRLAGRSSRRKILDSLHRTRNDKGRAVCAFLSSGALDALRACRAGCSGGSGYALRTGCAGRTGGSCRPLRTRDALFTFGAVRAFRCEGVPVCSIVRGRSVGSTDGVFAHIRRPLVSHHVVRVVLVIVDPGSHIVEPLPGFTGRARGTLGTFGTLGTLCARITFGTLGTRRARIALGTFGPLLACRTCGTCGTLGTRRARIALGTFGPLLACRTCGTCGTLGTRLALDSMIDDVLLHRLEGLEYGRVVEIFNIRYARLINSVYHDSSLLFLILYIKTRRKTSL